MKNYLTFRQLDSALIHKAGLNENDIVPALRLLYINNKLMKVYRLLDGLNDPWYHRRATLTVGSDCESSALTSQAIITPFNATKGEISITELGTLSPGTVAVVTIYNAAHVHQGTFAVVVTATDGDGCNYVTLEGTPLEYDGPNTTDYGTIYVIRSFSQSTASISSLYVKDIARIWDNGYTGGKERIFTEIKDPQIFSVLHRDPFFDGKIAWYHRGDSIDFYVPSAVTAGVVQMEYRGKPALATDFDSDVLIDIPPEDNQVLMDEVLAEYLTHMKMDIPVDVAQRQAEFQKRYEAATADIERKANLIKGKRGS